MANDAQYKKLKTELENLRKLADEQTHHFRRSRELLHKGLASCYMFWQEANQYPDLLERLYKEYDIQFKAETIHKIVFTPLLRYLWNADGGFLANTLDQWNRALNGMHIEVRNKREYYKIDTLNRLTAYVASNGGVAGLAGYADQKDAEKTSPKKLSKSAEKKLHDAHLKNGMKYFATEATAVAQFKATQLLPLAYSGFAVGLLRKTSNGYEIIGTTDDKELVDKAIVGAYGRNSQQMPNTARLLTEIIRTQTLPSSMANLTSSLAETSPYTVGEKKEKRKQLKRLMYSAKGGAFVLSENRATCSVVTVAKPFKSIIATNEDVALAVGDRKYIENDLIHRGDFNFYTADAAQKIPATKDETASHRLQLENSVTKHFRYVRFYPLSVYNMPSRVQAVVKSTLQYKPKFTAKLDSQWLSKMNAIFLSHWINGFGNNIKREEHKLLKLALSKTAISFGFNYKANDFTEAEQVDLDTGVATGNVAVTVLNKDIVPVLNALVHIEIDGDVTLQADEKMLSFSFKTQCAEYSINVPCCTTKAKRIGDYFEQYGE